MSSQDPPEGVSIDDLPDLPICKVSVAASADGVLRFEMEDWYAEELLGQLNQRLESYNGEGLIDFHLAMEYPNYVQLTKGFAELSKLDQMGAKQVSMHPEPDVAVEVIVNESQIESSMQANYKSLKAHGPGYQYGQQFSTDPNSIVMLIQQLEGVLNDGVDDPMDAIDTDDERLFDVEGDQNE